MKCDELKDYRISTRSDNVFHCYAKTEVDKVIAELEESHKMEVGQLLILNREQANAANRLNDSMEQAIRHQKYKRCLAMAKWCDDAARLATWDADYHRCGWYNKWMQHWLKIAEQFKEAK